MLFGSDDDENPNAGYLIWHDAWWIPPVTSDAKLSTGEQNRPFAEEVVTVHHQKYYQGGLEEALDIENPIPNQQLAVQGSFYFVIEGVYAWVQYAKKLLEQTLQQQGLGAKSSAGYGYFVHDEKLIQDVSNLYDHTKPIDPNDPLANIRKAVKTIQNELAETLGKGINKFFDSLGLNKEIEEDCKKVAQVVVEDYDEVVQSWANAPRKSNAEKAYKFIQKYR